MPRSLTASPQALMLQRSQLSSFQQHSMCSYLFSVGKYKYGFQNKSLTCILWYGKAMDSGEGVGKKESLFYNLYCSLDCVLNSQGIVFYALCDILHLVRFWGWMCKEKASLVLQEDDLKGIFLCPLDSSMSCVVPTKLSSCGAAGIALTKQPLFCHCKHSCTCAGLLVLSQLRASRKLFLMLSFSFVQFASTERSN